MNKLNPFSVVKANEYSDEEILENWVPFGCGTDEMYVSLHPNDLMPKYILGSKGCGKTHILRYYSYEGRKKHYKGDILELLNNDKYIASYSRLDGLSSMRFRHSDGSIDDIWVNLFNYYFEIHQAIISLQTYKDIVRSISVSEALVNKAISLIIETVGVDVDGNSIDNLIGFLNTKRIEIDRAIIDYSFTKTIDSRIKPLFPFGNLIFEIPHSFSSVIDELRDVNYIYVLDEYEKLRCDWQKFSLNTLVFEKKYNCTFWVGARKNGYTTKDTWTGEPIHEGHEFQPVDLDNILRSDENRFYDFAVELFKRRLKMSNIPALQPSDLFEHDNETIFLNVLAQKKDGLKHWNILYKRLESIRADKHSIDVIISGLKYKVEDNPLQQKLKLYVFYQEWNSVKNEVSAECLIDIVRRVNDQFDEYLDGNNKQLKEKMSKFKSDFIAQLSEENNEKYCQYSGFENLVSISDCNPRVFLTLMKRIIEDSIFRGISPFDGMKVNSTCQLFGIKDTAKWFLSDIEVYGAEREKLDLATSHLLDFFYVSRYCDKPVETSLCSFYYRHAPGYENIDSYLRVATNESFLLEASTRKDKTLGTPQKAYQINRLIAAMYKLPIARRGVASIPDKMLSSIFDANFFDQFVNNLTAHRKALNAPFGQFVKTDNAEVVPEPTLFD